MNAQNPMPLTPRSMPAGRGAGWLGDGWSLFAAQPWPWLGASLLYLFLLMGVNLIPLVGSLAGVVLNALLFAGLMIGAQAQDDGGRFRVGHLFAGFERAPGPLSAAGGLYLAGAFAISLLLVLLAAALLVPLGIASASLADLERGIAPVEQLLADPAVITVLLALILVATLLFTMLAMAMLFVPALIGIAGVPVLDAFRLSLVGCLRNLPPFLVFGLLLLLIVLAGGVLTAVLPLIGLLVLLLVLLILVPVMILALYLAYRDVFAGSA